MNHPQHFHIDDVFLVGLALWCVVGVSIWASRPPPEGPP